MGSLKPILKYVYVLMTHACATVFTGSIKRRQDVLLLRLDALGDFVLWLDAAKEYRVLYPKQTLTLFVNAQWLELARALPYWDHVVGVDTHRFCDDSFYRIQILRDLRHRGFDIVIQAQFSRSFLLGDSMMLSSGATQRVGFQSDTSNISARDKERGDRWYTQLIPNPPAEWGELRRNAEMVRALGLTSFQASLPVLPATVGTTRAEGSYYVLFPGAGRDFRRWPPERFAIIADKIFALTGMPGWICGSSQDRELASEILRLSKASFKDATGKTSVPELVGIIKGAKFVLSNETAAIHIAAAVGTKSICILGGGHFNRFVPYQVESGNADHVPEVVFHHMDCYGCGWSCKYDVCPGLPVPCIAHISVDAVWQKLIPNLESECQTR